MIAINDSLERSTIGLLFLRFLSYARSMKQYAARDSPRQAMAASSIRSSHRLPDSRPRDIWFSFIGTGQLYKMSQSDRSRNVGRERMLSSELISLISKRAREFEAGAIWLFGSSLEDDTSARDIDLAVEGLAPERFFPFYARLEKDLPKPVDLIDLSQDPPIRHIIRAKGLRIYER